MCKMIGTKTIDGIGDHQDYVDDVISDCDDVDVLNSIELLNVIDRDTLWDLHHADELNRFFNEKK